MEVARMAREEEDWEKQRKKNCYRPWMEIGVFFPVVERRGEFLGFWRKKACGSGERTQERPIK
jgi:hypothetical protein